MYLRAEQKDPNESRHKLAQVQERPYRVLKTGDKIVVIEKWVCSVENVSLQLVELDQNPVLKEWVDEIRKPTKVKDKDKKYPTKEDSDIK